MNLKTEIIKIVSEIQDEFAKDELAYLAVTSKIENPLRDKIAFALHKSLNQDYLICREWQRVKGNRTDLAIIEGKENEPKLLIEFKARSVPGYSSTYTDHLLSDLKKMAKVADDSTALYCIFFNTCIEKRIDSKFIKAVKYLNRINNRINEEKTIQEMIDEYWVEYLKGLPKNKYKKIEIQAGDYYKTPVSIITYIYGPIYKAEL
jgi:hypothetical protein